jgi:hypothetical protein
MDKERRNQLLKIRDYAEEQFDKLIVYLSSGGLILTIGFVKDVIPIEESSCKYLLLLTWVAFAVSLFTMLFSHRSSLRSMDLELNNEDGKSEFWNNVTKILNWVGMFVFIIGVVLFIIYILPKNPI